MFSAAVADCGEKFATLAVQCEAPVNAAKDRGEQLFVSVTAPCFFTNATGIVTLFEPEPLFGTRSIRPWYWPFATLGASIEIGKVNGPSLSICRVWLLFPTVIVTPAGSVICTSRTCFLPETLIAVRCVEIDPLIVVASMLGMFRSMRCSGSLPAATMCA